MTVEEAIRSVEETLPHPMDHDLVLVAEVKRLRKYLEMIAAYPAQEYGEDDADELDTLMEKAESVGRGDCGRIARVALGIREPGEL